MVQFINLPQSARGRLSDALGESLGGGLANFTGNYFANKALEEVLADKSLEGADQSKRMGALQRALSPYGDFGKNVMQQRMAVEQQMQQEKAEKQNALRTTAENKYVNGQPLTPEEDSLVRPDLKIAYLKATKPKSVPVSQQPIEPEQLDKIQKVREEPGFDDKDEVAQYRAFTKAGVSPSNAEREAKLKTSQLERQQKGIESSFTAQQKFIDETTKAYKGFETEMKPKLMQMQNIPAKDLISPSASVFLDQLGIPLGALENPSSELYDKLSQDLLKGLPETYGSRILKVEVDNFLKTIPRLMNSPDGRRMIASNMLKLGEMKEVYYNEMRNQQKDAIDNNKPLPRDFQQKVFDQVKPQIDRVNNEFVKLSEITSVPKGTIPFFNPSGDIEFVPENHVDWAEKNGGKRIW
jgi:hypothetical protein